jgi:hypothetical protein
MPGKVKPIFIYPSDHCGGSPSATQLQIIERCCWLTLKLSMLDAKIAAGKDSGFDNDQYLAWQGHLTRNLVKLGIQPAHQRPSRRSPTCSKTGRRSTLTGLGFWPTHLVACG